jgi:hypothetical protein
VARARSDPAAGAHGGDPALLPDGPALGTWKVALLVATAAAALILGAYLAHELYGAFIFPVGPDGPVYTWWIRYADVMGLEGVGAGRAGIPAAALVLGTALATSPVQTVMLLGPLLAATAGLAAASLLEASLGPHPARAFLGALLTGTFAAYLAGGWLANMGQAALFLGALACLALAGRSWRPVWVGGALLTASGIAHWIFSLVGLAVITGSLLAAAPEVLRALRRGGRLTDMAAVRVGIAAIGSVAGNGLGVASLAGGPGIPGDTSQDGFFRRAGLTDLLRDRYRERLGGDIARMAVPLATGAALAAGGLAGPDPGRSDLEDHGPTERRFLWRTLVTWAALTIVGAAVLAVSLVGPANRLLVFAFVVPLAAAVGAGTVLVRRRPALTAAVVILGLAFAGVSMYGWYRQYPSFAPDELAAATQAGEALRGQDQGTPVVFLVDTSEPAAAFHVTRFANVIRMGLPASLVPSSRFVVGRPGDLLEGRPTLTGDPEHDHIARRYHREAGAVPDEAWVLVLEPFNRDGFAEAAEVGSLLSPGIAVLKKPPDSRGRTTLPGGPGALRHPSTVDGNALGLAQIPLVTLTAGAIALLFVLGLGWARWGLPGASSLAAVCLAPAAGLAIVVLAGFVTDRLVPGAASPWGLLPAGLVSACGYVAAWGRRRGHRPRT